MGGYVVAAADVAESAEEAGTAATKLTIGDEVGSDVLEQRLIRFAPGRSAPPDGDGSQRDVALFALNGSGTIAVDGEPHPLAPETAVYVAAGESYEIDNDGPDDIEVVSVSVPRAAGAAADGPRRVTIRLADQESHRATTDRLFNYLVHPGVGCPSLTQFVGYVPTAPAATHYHPYDEVIYILDGTGVISIDGTETPLAAGTCIHLPPRQPHRLLNTGTDTMRLLGVFTPAGDPSEAYE